MNTSQVWRQDSLIQPVSGDVTFDGHSLRSLAAVHGTPLYVYSGARIRANLSRLREALASTGRPFTIRFAMKCNRFGPVLDLMRDAGDIGIDACSPGEVDLALRHGFQPDEIGITAGNLSNEDLAALAHYGVHLNSDTASVARRFAAQPAANAPRTFGIRLDPPQPLVRLDGEKLNYVGSKFGVSRADLPAVYNAAVDGGLSVDTLHVHCGWGMQQQHAEAFDAAMAMLAATAAALPGIRRINVGGGLSHPVNAADQPLDIATWAQILSKHFGRTSLSLECEIGTYIMANAGLLLMEVNSVEMRRGTQWAGVNSGHSVNVYLYHYGIPLELIPVNAALEPPAHRYQIGSNINEAEDMVGRDQVLPELHEGDVLAMYCAGAYGAAMQSNHCLRGAAPELLI
jgi:diaminopimelate decarboxylase